jgi:hypothetical protein
MVYNASIAVYALQVSLRGSERKMPQAQMGKPTFWAATVAICACTAFAATSYPGYAPIRLRGGIGHVANLRKSQRLLVLALYMRRRSRLIKTQDIDCVPCQLQLQLHNYYRET